VRVKGYDGSDTFYAATAAKARMEAWRTMDSIARIADISVSRDAAKDVHLPDRHQIADQLSNEEEHCLLHAFGGNGDPIRAGYRDHFYTRRDDPPLVRLAELGLMDPMKGDKFGENMTYFVLTDLGKAVALSLVPEYRR